MKTKCILGGILFSLIWINSFADYTGDYCQFNGIKQTQDKDTEFKMLLEPLDEPNFITISSVVSAIAVDAPITDLKNPKCKISEYTKKLLAYYKKHKDEIKTHNQDMASLLEKIQKKLKSN